jgi:CBS domain-containing protein
MATHHVHALAVIGVSHREPECGVWGIVSDLDLVRAGIRNGSDETARSLAAQPLLSVAPALPLREAAELMISNRASHVVVIDPATWRPVGTLSTSTSPACSPGARRRDRRRLSQGCQQAG